MVSEMAHSDRLWTVDLEDFVGQAIVAESFAFDGRAEDYEHLFSWTHFGRRLWEGERYGVPYEVVELSDFEPFTVVLRADGETVGFYMDGMIWIDESHRGRHLSVEMIRAAISARGVLPDLNQVGFSASGYAAHVAAHRESCREAVERGDLALSQFSTDRLEEEAAEQHNVGPRP